MRERTYCCPRLFNRGFWVLGDCLTAIGQVNTTLIPQISRATGYYIPDALWIWRTGGGITGGRGNPINPLRGRVVLCQYPKSKGTDGSDRGEARLRVMGAPTGVQCATQALPLRPERVVAESTSGGQDVRFWTGVHAGLHRLLTTRGSHTHIEAVPIFVHSLFSHQKVIGGGSQRQLLDRTLQVVPRAQFGISAIGTRMAVLGSHLREMAYSV